MKTKHFLFSAFFVLMLHFSTPIHGQSGSSSLFAGEQPALESGSRFHLQASTLFMGGLAGGSFFTQSVAPSFNWDISRRFNLQIGTILSSTRMNGTGAFFPFTPHMAGGESVDVLERQNLFGSTFYAAGSYQVNPRLSLTGGAWMERNELPGISVNDQAFATHPRGAMFGFDYRVSENFRFGAEFSVSSGYHPLNPFYQNSLPGNPFRSNSYFHSPAPFHKGSRW